MEAPQGQAAGLEFDPATRGIMPDEGVTRLHLLRHGAVQRLDRRVVRGQMDLPLSEDGARQSEQLAGWLAVHEARPDRIFSSDLVRCVELGERLARDAGRPLERSAELREQDMGDWQGRTWEEITRADGARVTAYWDDYVTTRPPGGESFGELSERVTRWWESVAADVQGQTVAVVTHVGVIRCLLCLFLGVPTSDALRFAPATASHTSLLSSAAGCVLNTFGERPWLTGPPGPS